MSLRPPVAPAGGRAGRRPKGEGRGAGGGPRPRGAHRAVAALDLGTAELVGGARVPSPSGRAGGSRRSGPPRTRTRSLLVLAERRGAGRDPGVMEATSDARKPVFCLLEAHRFEAWLVDGNDGKQPPGRPRPTGPAGGPRPPGGRRRLVAASATLTASCCQPWGPASTRPAPTWPWWRPSSGPRSARSPRRSTGWRSSAGRPGGRPGADRRARHRPGPLVSWPGPHPGQGSAGTPGAGPPPATATRSWPGCWATRRPASRIWVPAAPRPASTPRARKRHHGRQLQALGSKVTLHPAA
jgi:hypothetical protein